MRRMNFPSPIHPTRLLGYSQLGATRRSTNGGRSATVGDQAAHASARGDQTMDFAMRTSGGLLLLAFAVAASAQQPACKVDPFPRARKGETVLVKMHVLNNGTACSISPH